MIESIAGPLRLSLQISIFATFFAFTAGVLLAWIFAFHKNKLTSFLSIIVTIPLILPPTVLGYYLLVTLGRNSVIGQTYEALFGGPIVFTWQAAVAAAAIAALPLLIRPMQAAFESIDVDYLGAARLDGASSFQLLRFIILPIAWRGVLAGVVLGFARAMGEFGATLMVAGNIPGRTQTLSIAIYDAVQADRIAEANFMAAVLTAFTVAILYLVHRRFAAKV
ncbi:molybdate ABC transporter permease subunit [Alkalicoccus daliensis]|uniref:Molybdenum transport system permease n=1 Tax=Alkalicoccus daliensis TaxID=745820 RepID=A0A1H0IQH8_9BACI|nr:molybdate ABC transporter permease subunit [Alkalicoccus daliensis]SDO33281.1 molybdate transport system permease protein [Alkalicoccus daliensis]